MRKSRPLYQRLGCLPITLIIAALLAFKKELTIFIDFFTTVLTVTDPFSISAEPIFAMLTLLGYLILFVVLLLLMICLLSQLVLPIKNLDDWWRACVILLGYFVHYEGPIVWVRDGKIVKKPGEKKASRPGVVLVDFNSAIVLSEKNIKGTGLWFTKKGEKFREAVDLRRHTRTNDDIQGTTRDGIKVKTKISITFTLSENLDILYVTSPHYQDLADVQVIQLQEKKTASGNVKFIEGFIDGLIEEDKQDIYHYIQSYHLKSYRSYPPAIPVDNSGYISPFSVDPKRIAAAVKYRFKNVEDGRFNDYDDYPANIATDVFRDLLIHEKYDDLFLPEELEKYPLKDFRDKFSRRVQCQGLIAVQYVVRHDKMLLKEGQFWDERELLFYPYQLLRSSTILRDRGIKVISAGFAELEPNEKVKEQMFKTWQAKRVREEKETQADSALKVTRIRSRARVQAQRDMVYALSQIFQAAPHSKEALAVRIYQALEATATDPVTRQFLSKEVINMLDNLRKWLLQEPKNGPKSV